MSNGKRFGGAHSPGGARPSGGAKAGAAAKPVSAFAGRKVKSFSWRVLLLYIAPSWLIFAVLEGIMDANLFHILWSLGCYGALMLAAWLTGQGLQAEAAFDERIVAMPPAFPRKMVASGLTGVAVAAACYLGASLNPFLALFYGVVAGAAHLTAFGPDPMRAKGVEGVSSEERDRVAAKIDEAETIVAETVKAAAALGDRRLERRIDGLAYAARDILKEIQADPRDMRRSRQFLSVHLVGLRDATVKLASATAKGAGADQRGEYEALLGDLEQSFSKTRDNLLIDDQTALEVEIEVLRDRLKQEGAL